MKMHSEVIEVRARKVMQFVDISGQVAGTVRRSGIASGFVLVRSRHTTAAVTCTEADADVHQDCVETLDELMPVSRDYHHIYEGKNNARAHQAQLLGFGHATWVAVRAGQLDLGTWQRLFLVELYRPMVRKLDCVVVGE
jgi:secondary thiamine-phosphate synthase enzyme